MATPAALPATDSVFPTLLTDVLAVSLTAIHLLRPVYNESGELTDFAVAYLNPAAQRTTGLSEQPGGTLRTRFPDTVPNGVLDLCKRVFETGEAAQHDLPGPPDSPDRYRLVAARRSGEWLVVSFANPGRPPGPVAAAPRQVHEDAIQRENARLSEIYKNSEGLICILAGPDYVFELVNPTYHSLFGQRPLLGKPLFEALPELVGQSFETLLDTIYRTGQPVEQVETPVEIDCVVEGITQRRRRYFNGSYQARRDEQGCITGLIVLGYDVTTQVEARQLVEDKERQTNVLNEELARLNDRLRASNAEYLRANTALARAEQQQHLLNQQLDALNQSLETQVATHTQEARAQRGRLERLVMAAPIAICVFDGPEWVYQLVNPRYQQMFPGRELLGLRLVDALPEVADQPLMDILHHVYDTGIPFESREVLVPLARTATGPVEDIYFDLTYQARYNEEGQIDGFITFANDVTEQVLGRQQHEAQQQQLRDLFEQAPVAIAILSGPTYLIDVANPLMAQLWGRASAQVLGRPLLDALPEVREQGFGELLDQVVATGEAFAAQEISAMLDRNGQLETVYLNFVYQPLLDAQGRVTSVAVVATEVGEQVRVRQQVQLLNEELAALNESLQEANRGLTTSNHQLTRTNADLDNFIYTASHDLKAPISNIEGLLRLLEDLLPTELRTDENLLPVLGRMQDSVERFTRTISHLTEVSKLQVEFSHPAILTPLTQVIDEVRQDLAPLFAETGGQLQVHVAECPTLLISEKNLRSVLYNLISNALKYHHPDRTPVVRLSCRLEQDRRVLRVHDNGLGLSEGQQSRLFQLFQRLHTHVEGTGVGLYMVKKMVENAQGVLSVESQEGVGTTFTASFPL